MKRLTFKFLLLLTMIAIFTGCAYRYPEVTSTHPGSAQKPIRYTQVAVVVPNAEHYSTLASINMVDYLNAIGIKSALYGTAEAASEPYSLILTAQSDTFVQLQRLYISPMIYGSMWYGRRNAFMFGGSYYDDEPVRSTVSITMQVKENDSGRVLFNGIAMREHFDATRTSATRQLCSEMTLSLFNDWLVRNPYYREAVISFVDHYYEKDHPDYNGREKGNPVFLNR